MQPSHRYQVIFLSIAVLLLIPVWIHSLVPLVDLPVHMGRAYAYFHFDEDPVFSSYLHKASPWTHNAAAELLIAPLLAVCTLERATQWFLTFYLLLFAAACDLLGRAVRGGETEGRSFGPPLPAMLPCLFLSYHSMYQYGYVSYSAGLAAALFTLALRIGWGRRWTIPRLALLTALCTFTYLMHLSAAAMLGLAWGLWSLAEWRRRGRLALWDAASFLAFIPMTILYLHHGRGAAGGHAVWPSAAKKALHLLAGFTSYSVAATGIAAFCCLTGLALALWFHRRALRPVPLLAAAAFFLLFAASPDEMHGAADVDVRFVPMALVMAAAALPAAGGRAGAALLGLVLAGLTIRQADILAASHAASVEMERQLPSLDVIEPHALVNTYVWLDTDPAVNKRSRHQVHYSALALPRRHVRDANLALTPHGTWPLEARSDFQQGAFLPPGGSFAALDWKRMKPSPAYLWTYGLPPRALMEIRPFARLVYEAGAVRVFQVQEAASQL